MLARSTGLLDKPFNIVLMGMGEPLHNYDETMKALRLLNEKEGFDMHPKRVTLSTVGLVPMIDKLAQEDLMPNLAVSLHAATEEQRARDRAADARSIRCRTSSTRASASRCRSGAGSCSSTSCCAGVNDSDEDARKLVKVLAGVKAKVNLLPLNAAPGIPFERPSDERINAFAKILAEPRPDGLGAQEPRARHPGGVRTADRRRTDGQEVGGPASRRGIMRVRQRA